MSDIVRTSEFDLLLPYITEIRQDFDGRYFMKLEIPPGLRLDQDKVLGIMAEDATISFSSGGSRTLTGHFRDVVVGKYLMDQKMYIRFSFDPDAFEGYIKI